MSRVEQDGLRLLRTSSLNRDVVLGAVAVMACDAWRVRAALELAARGGGPLEAYDELVRFLRGPGATLGRDRPRWPGSAGRRAGSGR